jgi:hypothetical protein
MVMLICECPRISITTDEISERMSEVFAVRLLDALDGNGPHVRSHDGKRLIPAG